MELMHFLVETKSYLFVLGTIYTSSSHTAACQNHLAVLPTQDPSLQFLIQKV